MSKEQQSLQIESESSGTEMAEIREKKEQSREQLLVVSSVTFYFVASLLLVFLNKTILSGGIKLDNATVFLTWTQIVVTVVLSWVFCQVREATGQLRFLAPWEYKLKTALAIWPVTLSFCGMIIFNNLCLKYVEITFYQVARSLTIAFNVVFAYSVWGESTSRNCLVACFVVVFGYVTGVDGEINFSWAGVIFGASSSCCLSLYSIFVKKYMKSHLNDDQWLLLYYNNVNAMFVMPLISFAFGEHVSVMDSTDLWSAHSLWLLAFAGVLGTLMNIASFFQIKYTSPLTHNVSGTAKSCVQSILAWLIYRNPISGKAFLGLASSILGSFAYGYFRFQEGEAAKAEKAAAKLAAELAEQQALLKSDAAASESTLTSRA